MLEFDIRIKVAKYDETTSKNSDFPLTEKLITDIREHLESSILGSPFIVPDTNQVFVYSIEEEKVYDA